MPDGVRTKENQTPARDRLRLTAWLRPLVPTLLFVLQWFFRVVNRQQRQVLVKIPGLLALYNSLSPLCLSARSEGGIPCARVNGLKMYLDPAEKASRAAAFLWGQYEVATTAIVTEVVTEGDAVVDVGAHWGYFTLLAATLCGEQGRVFAFEPHPRNYALLTKNIRGNGLTNVVAVQKAVANHTGTAKLFQARSTSGHSVCGVPLAWRSAEDSANGGLTVETVALDDFFAATSLGPRLVKMDIEGAEPLALAGMRRLIERSPSLVLISEFNPSYLDAKAAADFLDQLAAWGFDLAIVDDERRQLAIGPKNVILQWLLDQGSTCNLLATRDRALFERLLQPWDGLGKYRGRLESVRL